MPDADIWVASGVTAFTAPPGTPLSDSAAWKQVAGVKGASFVNGRIEYDKVTRDWLAANYVIPQRWMAGIDPSKWDASIINERSKPMGLTKEHVYTDTMNDRTLRIEDSASDPQAPYINVSGKVGGAGIWLDRADAIPLALNVLGYDRLDASERRRPDDAQSLTPKVGSDTHRDALLDVAVSNLKAVDLYDQRAAECKAKEAASRAVEAEHAASLAARDAARDELHAAARNIGRVGIYSSSLSVLKEATEAYEAAQAALSPVPFTL